MGGRGGGCHVATGQWVLTEREGEGAECAALFAEEDDEAVPEVHRVRRHWPEGKEKP